MNKPQSPKQLRTYNAHETGRMLEVHGVPLASFPRRASAFILDFFVAFGLFLIVIIPAGRIARWLEIPIGNLNLQFDFSNWYSFVFLVIYFALSTWLSNGRTVGKWIFGIRVVSLVHERMSLFHSAERALGYAASFLEFGFGFYQYFIHPNRRTVHDRIAETIVILERKPRSGSQKTANS